jgi:hypothetical protein
MTERDDPSTRTADLRTAVERVESAVKLATALAALPGAPAEQFLLLNLLGDAHQVLAGARATRTRGCAGDARARVVSGGRPDGVYGDD